MEGGGACMPAITKCTSWAHRMSAIKLLTAMHYRKSDKKKSHCGGGTDAVSMAGQLGATSGKPHLAGVLPLFTEV